MTLFSLLTWAVFGLVVGSIARWLMPAKRTEGRLATICVGVLGSVAGGLPFGEGPAGLVGSVIGAVVVIWILNTYGGSDRV